MDVEFAEMVYKHISELPAATVIHDDRGDYVGTYITYPNGYEESVEDISDVTEDVWYQRDWIYSTASCGTAACFAGWAWVLDGKPTISPGNHYGEWAQQRLDISEQQANQLFYAGNELADIRRLLDKFIEAGDLAGELE